MRQTRTGNDKSQQAGINTDTSKFTSRCEHQNERECEQVRTPVRARMRAGANTDTSRCGHRYEQECEQDTSVNTSEGTSMIRARHEREFVSIGGVNVD